MATYNTVANKKYLRGENPPPPCDECGSATACMKAELACFDYADYQANRTPRGDRHPTHKLFVRLNREES